MNVSLRVLFTSALLVPIGLASQAVAQPYRVGDRIVCIADAKLTVGTTTVDDVWPGLDFTVNDVKGQWLWVSNGHPGWLDQRHVIPLNRAAIDRLTAMLNANPSSRLYAGRGSVWHALGELDIAIADFNEAIRRDPADSAWYSRRGTAWMDKGDYDRAIADYNEALRLDSNAASTYNNRGMAWRAKREYDRAIADYNEALRLDPRDFLVYLNRGNALYDNGQRDRALADIDEALRLDPRNAKAYNNRGFVRSSKGEYDRAIEDFNTALRLGLNPPTVYRNRGNAWSGKGEYNRALQDYREAVRVGPKDAASHNALAWFRATCPDERYRDGQEAISHARLACELDDSNTGFIDTLAACFAEAGNFTEAVATQQKAVDLAPADQKADFRSRLTLYKQRKPYRELPNR